MYAENPYIAKFVVIQAQDLDLDASTLVLQVPLLRTVLALVPFITYLSYPKSISFFGSKNVKLKAWRESCLSHIELAPQLSQRR